MAARTVCAQELLGRSVYMADGKRLGRVYDLVAEKHGEELALSGLLVGPASWLVRFGWTKRQHGRLVPWESIASLGPSITLHPGARTVS